MQEEGVVARCLGLLLFRRPLCRHRAVSNSKGCPGVFEEPESFKIRQGLRDSDWHVVEKRQDSYDTAGGLVMAL